MNMNINTAAIQLTKSITSALYQQHPQQQQR